MPKLDMLSLWEKTIHTRAQASKNSELYNVLAHWNVGKDRMQSLSLEGWESTGDVRFAISYFIEAKTQAWNDPQLEKAVSQFPDNSLLASLRLSKMAQANQPVQEPLVAAILAEYRGFSMGGPLTPRPSAKKLRAMFKELVRLQNEP